MFDSRHYATRWREHAEEDAAGGLPFDGRCIASYNERCSLVSRLSAD